MNFAPGEGGGRVKVRSKIGTFWTILLILYSLVGGAHGLSSPK